MPRATQSKKPAKASEFRVQPPSPQAQADFEKDLAEIRQQTRSATPNSPAWHVPVGGRC